MIDPRRRRRRPQARNRLLKRAQTRGGGCGHIFYTCTYGHRIGRGEEVEKVREWRKVRLPATTIRTFGRGGGCMNVCLRSRCRCVGPTATGVPPPRMEKNKNSSSNAHRESLFAAFRDFLPSLFPSDGLLQREARLHVLIVLARG